MLRKFNDCITFSLIGFFKVSFFLSLLFLFAILFVKFQNACYKESLSSLNVLNRPVLRFKEHMLFYSEAQEATANLESLREELDIFRLILRFSNDISTYDAVKLAKLIKEGAETYGLNPFLILAIIQVESEFSPKAISPKGALGLMQIMPETAEYVAGDLGVSIDGIKSLHNPFINVRLGIHYLSMLINRFKSVEWALCAYNAGPSFLNASGFERGIPAYVRKVLRFKNILESQRMAEEQSL
jgi:soluble lytic murein transglycosylase-like protein